MNKGKAKCDKLKAIRRAIAEANNIDFTPSECTFEGECDGTCPYCDAEIEKLNQLLAQKEAEGGEVVIPNLYIGQDSAEPHYEQTDDSQVWDFEGKETYREKIVPSPKRPLMGIPAYDDEEEQEKRKQQWAERTHPRRKLKITKAETKETERVDLDEEESRLMGRLPLKDDSYFWKRFTESRRRAQEEREKESQKKEGKTEDSQDNEESSPNVD